MDRKLLIFFFSVLVTVIFQFQAIKFGDIKLPEIVVLALMPFLFLRKINKLVILFILYFIFISVITFIINLNQTFYIPLSVESSLLKQPYYITISRFIEYFICLVFVVFVYKSMIYFYNIGIPIERVLKTIIRLNTALGIFYIFVFLIYTYYGIELPLGLLSHDGARLSGLFIEGGNLGLFYTFLFCLSLTFFSIKHNFFSNIIFLVVIILAQSKAGFAVLAVYLFFYFYFKIKHKVSKAIFVFLSLVFIILGIAILNIDIISNVEKDIGLSNYISNIKNIEYEVMDRPEDNNLVMGRIAGIYISKEMIINNPLLGIGQGNYSIVRNDPTYLGIIPPTVLWDLTGLGGLFNLLVENGIIGFFGFFLIILSIVLYFKNNLKYRKKVYFLILIFILPLGAGVQLYFTYIWFVVALIIAYKEINEKERLCL